MLIVLTFALVSLMTCVGIHYQLFATLSQHLPRLHTQERWRVMLGVMATLGAHLIEGDEPVA